MKNFAIKTLIILIIFIPLFTTVVMANGYIIIESISGVEIFIDDEFVGLTDEDDMLIEKVAGDYELSAKKEGYYEHNLSVEVESLESTFIVLEMEKADILARGIDENEMADLGIKTGTLVIRSIPYTGADIRLEGQLVGNTNSRFNPVLAGDINVEISINDKTVGDIIKLNENEEKTLLAHYAMNPPQLIELFELNFAGVLPEDYFIEIQGEYSTVKVDDISKPVVLMGSNHKIKVNNGNNFFDYQKNVNLTENNNIKDLPLPRHYLNMVFVETGSTPIWYGGLEIENSFYISKYHVTQAEFEEVMGFNPSRFSGNKNNPVECVTWYDAAKYCNILSENEGLENYYNISKIEYYDEYGKLGSHPNNIKYARITGNKEANGYRLPTRDEHEYAARGGANRENTKYAGSNNLDEVAWYWKNSGDKVLISFPVYNNGLHNIEKIAENNNRTHPVGQKKPNELGLYDMVGNVWDWTSTFLKATPVDFPYKRGGSYQCYSDSVDIFELKYHKTTRPSARYYYNGFRLVKSF